MDHRVGLVTVNYLFVYQYLFGLGTMLGASVLEYQKTIRMISSSRISLKLTVDSHGWVDLVPWVWDESNGSLSRYESIGPDLEGMITLTQTSPTTLELTVDTNKPANDLSKAKDFVIRWLSIDWLPDNAIVVAGKLDKRISQLLKIGAGRMLRGSTFYEDFVKTICTIQMSWSGTKRMLNSLMELNGTKTFPTPLEIMDIGELNLREKAKFGFRAATLINSTDKLLSQGWIDNYGNSSPDTISKEVLLELNGIGPYSANHMRVLQRDFSSIPVDSVVSRYCKERYGIESDEIPSFFDPWGAYRFLGYRLDRVARRLENQLPN